MKHLATRTALALSLTLGLAAGPLAVAQDAAAVDEAVAATPTALADLLGPAGVGGIESDFYLWMELPGQGTGVMHWSTAVDDDLIRFTMINQMNDGEMTSTQYQVFTTEGEFVESGNTMTSSDFHNAQTAVREGEKVRVTNSSSFDGQPGGPAEASEEVSDYQPVADTIPTAWLPMAFAYHIREGHEQFVVRMTDDVTGREMTFVQVFTAEDIGTEVVEIGEAEHEAHVFMLTMTSEVDGQPADTGEPEMQMMQMYVLADGSIVRMSAEYDGVAMSAQAVTAEEAQTLMDAEAEGDAADAVEDTAE
ncbi:hypothetical protein OT109_05180 [Phycisphaeraceae bacterium D3-23]